MSLPRRRISPQLIGAVVAAAGFGGVFLLLGRQYGSQQVFFYVFALIAVLSGIRVISHPRPVYAALYFIFTILSSSVLYLLLRAEFMAFALLIIYAGAILITYLFVIMLATQAPTEDQPEALSEYDSYSREPILAAALGFVLLAVLTGYMNRGVNQINPRDVAGNQNALLAEMPRKQLEALADRGVFEVFERPPLSEVNRLINPQAGTISLRLAESKAEQFAEMLGRDRFAELFGGTERAGKLSERLRNDAGSLFQGGSFAKAGAGDGTAIISLPVRLAPEAGVDNVELVGFALIGRHPMALELAGVILLMAMLGAVVLARKQVEIGESEKVAAAMRGASTLAGPRGYGDSA